MDRSAILKRLCIDRLYFWGAVSAMLLNYCGIRTYVNSRTANPYTPVIFEDQNKILVIYERSSAVGSLKRLMADKLRHAKTQKEKDEVIEDYLSLKKSIQ